MPPAARGVLSRAASHIPRPGCDPSRLPVPPRPGDSTVDRGRSRTRAWKRLPDYHSGLRFPALSAELPNSQAVNLLRVFPPRRRSMCPVSLILCQDGTTPGSEGPIVCAGLILFSSPHPLLVCCPLRGSNPLGRRIVEPSVILVRTRQAHRRRPRTARQCSDADTRQGQGACQFTAPRTRTRACQPCRRSHCRAGRVAATWARARGRVP